MIIKITITFTKLKNPSKEEDLKRFRRLRQGTVTKEAYQDCFKKWKHRWDKCVRWRGEYFEGAQTCNFQIHFL